MKDGFAGCRWAAEEMEGTGLQSHEQKMRFKKWKTRGVVFMKGSRKEWFDGYHDNMPFIWSGIIKSMFS